jgi:hypothetical protein
VPILLTFALLDINANHSACNIHSLASAKEQVQMQLPASFIILFGLARSHIVPPKQFGNEVIDCDLVAADSLALFGIIQLLAQPIVGVAAVVFARDRAVPSLLPLFG